MASHHHYHHHTVAATNPTPISTVCHCYSCHPTPSPYPTPSYTPYPPPHFTPPPPYNPHTHCECEKNPHHNQHFFQQVNHQVNKVPDDQTQIIVTSLLRRISALESSHRRSSSSSRQSLRDAAARTIQTHFRAFLARRSRTLRQLKQLASIKTTLNVLKSSVSGKTHFDFDAVSYRAMDLLVKLDYIQGDDPLIRDGKKSITRELTRFMKAVNGVSVFSSRIVKSVRNGNKARASSSDHKMEFGRNLNEAIDKFVASVNESEEEDEEEHQNPRFSEAGKSGVLRNRDQGGFKPKQKKSVSFAENVDAQESFDAEIELMKNLSKRVENLGALSKDAEVDEAEEDGGRSSGSSDNEIMDQTHGTRKDGYRERNVRDENETENESFLFSSPLPVKMDARAAADYININRKKGVKIVDN